ncbi:hypothetical protein ROHU_030324 [Labeo rohita]|uniref:Uncharacterized protein n=1 Tax=Labeo rohita TaxID=84645 RepID=A0A498LV24_LABRO|nr:hypothetical protein ROHU_030324 [Labeo rohita]
MYEVTDDSPDDMYLEWFQAPSQPSAADGTPQSTNRQLRKRSRDKFLSFFSLPIQSPASCAIASTSFLPTTNHSSPV